MKKWKSVSFMAMFLLCLTISAYDGKMQTIADESDIHTKAESGVSKVSDYDNPIDAYFLPRMEEENICMIELRELQSAYRKTWKAEFENVVQWLQEKCVYEEDRTKIDNWKKSVEKNIQASREVAFTEMLDVYEIAPDPEKAKDHISRISYIGNGTSCYLEQLEGEQYRNAAMMVIDLFGSNRKYSFRDMDDIILR